MAVTLAFIFWSGRVSAVIVYGSAGGNTTPPTGIYADSGWQYQGDFGSYLGTAISPTQFITAEHIGYGVTPTFVYDSVTYSVDTTPGSIIDVPGTDLRIYSITSGSFSSYAEIYTGTITANMEFVTMGRGASRGAAIVSPTVKGWYAGTSDFDLRWGTNNVSSIQNDANLGSLLVATFDSTSGVNEAYLSVGDSGGGVFVFDTADNTWKLAGVNLGDSGYFSLSSDGSSPFRGALYDMGGAYYDNGAGYSLINNTPSNIPASIFISSVTASSSFIQGVAPVPEPTGSVMVALGGLLMILRRRRTQG